MSAALTLSWRSLPYDPAAFFVKGTELAAAYVPGTNCRFVICETRGGRDASGHSTLIYRLRDAHTVSDDDLRAGRRSKVVGVFDDPDKAIAAALASA